jgi:hypothetical protein
LRTDSYEDGNSFGFDFFTGSVFGAHIAGERDRDFAFSSIRKAVDGGQAGRYGTRRRILDKNEANRRDEQRCFYAAASPFGSRCSGVQASEHKKKT